MPRRKQLRNSIEIFEMDKLKTLLISLQGIKGMLKDKKAGKWPKVVLILAVVYLFFPFDFINDLIPLLGLADDILILIAAFTTIGKSYKTYKRTSPIS